MKKSKRIFVVIVAVCMTTLAAISTNAVSDVHCIGGGGTNNEIHRYGLLWSKSHDYIEYYHDVDRVYNNVVYGNLGHKDTGCSENDFYSYCPPGTVVGQG